MQDDAPAKPAERPKTQLDARALNQPLGFPTDSATLETIPAGAYIVDLGSGTSLNNQLKPYGLVFDLVANHATPLLWAIADGKTADTSEDFHATTAQSTKTYTTSAFIIHPEFAPSVKTTIEAWRDEKGVIVDGPTTMPIVDAPIYGTIATWPRTALDNTRRTELNVVKQFYQDAGIPVSPAGNPSGTPRAPYERSPNSLSSTKDDLLATLVAEPKVATHSKLNQFNSGGGYIWAGGVTPIELEEMVDQSTNPDTLFSFLSTEGIQENNPDDGPFLKEHRSDPIQQYVGSINLAAKGGDGKVYEANPLWRASTKVLVRRTPSQPGEPVGALLVYGRGFGEPERGMVMYKAGFKAPTNTDKKFAADLAAKRSYLNFSLMTGLERSPRIKATVDPASVSAGQAAQLSSVTSGGEAPLSWKWTATCDGTFSNAAVQNPTFTPASGIDASSCMLRVDMTDSNSRFGVDGVTLNIDEGAPDLRVSKSVDPASGTAVIAGESLTYTLLFSNENGSMPADVEHSDHLNGVLDDADVDVGSITAEADLTASPKSGGSQIEVIGQVPAGEVRTVTFEVTVKPDPDRGDHELLNFLTPSGEAPPTECVESSSLCTKNPVSFWDLAKTASPVSTSMVSPGDIVSYAVTAISGRGEIPNVVLSDDLSGVLGDAVFVPDSARLAIDGQTPQPVADATDEQLVTEPFVLPAGATATLTYQVTVGMDAWSQSLVNTAGGMADGGSPFPPSACATADPNPGEQCSTAHPIAAHLFLEKWGSNDGQMVPIDGGQFEVHLDDSGTPGTVTGEVFPVLNEIGRFEAKPFAPGDYWLVETRAPAGHSLLAEPVAFTIASDGALSVAAGNPQVTTDAEKPLTIRVTDLPAIGLPLTGGDAPSTLILGILILGLIGFTGFLIWRQRSGKPVTT